MQQQAHTCILPYTPYPYTSCVSCCMFLFHDNEVQYCQTKHILDYLHRFKDNNFLHHMQVQLLAGHRQALVPLCKRCHMYTLQRWKTRNNKTNIHPVYAVIQFIGNGCAAPCPDKRCIIPIVRSLARRIQFPDNTYQYNPIIANPQCPETLRTIVQWLHQNKFTLSKFHDFNLVCAPSFWLNNALYIWGVSRENTRFVRAYLRKHAKKPLIVRNVDNQDNQDNYPLHS